MDGDGDLDLALFTLQGLRLYQNQSEPRPFVRISLRATKSHPVAIGAEVRVRMGDKVQYETLHPTEGFQTQQPLDLNFSWDSAERIDDVHVTWPSGMEQTFAGVPLGKRVTLVEGVQDFEVEDIPEWPAECRNPAELARAEIERPKPKDNSAKPKVRQIRVVRFGADPNASWPLRDELQTEFPRVQFETVDWDALTGRVLVYDLEDDLARAFFESPEPTDLGALLTELAEEPWFSGLALQTGRRLLAQKKPEEAMRMFESVLVEDPRAPAAAEGLARAKRMVGDAQGAEAAYRRSVEIDPDYAIGHFNLAVMHVHMGKLELAMKSYEETLRIRGEHMGTLLAMGEAALLGGDREKAIAYFIRAGNAEPTEAEPHILRGKVLGQLKRYDEAGDAFRRALELDPQNKDVQRAHDNAERMWAESFEVK